MVFEKLSEIADIPLGSEEFRWIITHIKVISIYDVEKFAFIGENIINEIATLLQKEKLYDYSLADAPHGTIKNKSLMSFKKSTSRAVDEVAQQMISEGLII